MSLRNLAIAFMATLAIAAPLTRPASKYFPSFQYPKQVQANPR